MGKQAIAKVNKKNKFSSFKDNKVKFCLTALTDNILLLSTGNCKIINLSEENILWGFKI